MRAVLVVVLLALGCAHARAPVPRIEKTSVERLAGISGKSAIAVEVRSVDGKPLAGATAIVSSTTDGDQVAISNDNGRLEFGSLTPGPCVVRLYYGSSGAELAVELRPNERLLLAGIMDERAVYEVDRFQSPLVARPRRSRPDPR